MLNLEFIFEVIPIETFQVEISFGKKQMRERYRKWRKKKNVPITWLWITPSIGMAYIVRKSPINIPIYVKVPAQDQDKLTENGNKMNEEIRNKDG